MLSLYKSEDDQYRIGFLDSKPDLSSIYDLTLLNQVLEEKGLQKISSDMNAPTQSGTAQQPSVISIQQSSPSPTENAGSVVPEFGPVASIVFAIAIIGIVASAVKTRVIPQL